MVRNTEERLAEEYQNVALASTTGSSWYFKVFDQEIIVYISKQSFFADGVEARQGISDDQYF